MNYRANRKLHRQMRCAIGRTVDFPGYGPVVITRWTGHDEPWPCGRFARDPKYFGALIFADERARSAALEAGKTALNPTTGAGETEGGK